MRNKRQKQPQQKQEAYLLGEDCFHKGRLNNPFKRNSFLFREWQRGFDNAYFNNLERVAA